MKTTKLLIPNDEDRFQVMLALKRAGYDNWVCNDGEDFWLYIDVEEDDTK